MSAFSRGLGLGLSLRQKVFSFVPKTAGQSCAQYPMARVAQSIRQSPIIQAARNLQTSARLHAQKAARSSAPRKPTAVPQVAAKPKPPSPVPDAAAAAATTSEAIAARLAARGRPTTLYEGPSHFWLHFSSLAAATFFIAYAFIAYTNFVAKPPEGLHWLVPHLWAFVCLFMAACGLYFMYSSAFIIRRLTAVPTASLPPAYLKDLQALAAGATATATTTAAGKGGGVVKGKLMSKEQEQTLRAMAGSPVVVECELSKIIPFVAAKKIYAAPSQVEVPFRFAGLRMQRSHNNNNNNHGANDALPRPPVDAIGKIAQPFERLGKGTGAAWSGLKRGLTREGWSPIKIKGMRYKIDVNGGKVLDMGKAVDQLVRHRTGSKFGRATAWDKLCRI